MALACCNLIVIDNFYKNPHKVRQFALEQKYTTTGNYPGTRTKSFANLELKGIIGKYIEPFGGEIVEFPLESESYNGSFQYTVSRDRSWIHTDSFNNWGGILYLTPDAPLSSGTAFYRIKNGSMYEAPLQKDYTDSFSQDYTKWDLVDQVGNVFNRLVLFNSHNYHMSMDYFGDTKENGRLFQVFFFSTEK